MILCVASGRSDRNRIANGDENSGKKNRYSGVNNDMVGSNTPRFTSRFDGAGMYTGCDSSRVICTRLIS